MKQLLHIFSLLFITSLFSQQQDFEVFNTSINSKYAELGVTYLNENTVFFASSKKNDDDDKLFKKDRRKNNRQLYLELYKAVILENGDLLEINKFSNEINNKFFESDITFTSDRKTIYFTWNNFYSTEKRIDSAKWKTLQIMKADINENLDISNIVHLPFNNEKYSVRSPKISKNGKQLFFVSDMPNGFGKTDIYVVDILGENSYSNPRNLGPNVNTKESELFPYIAKNKTLYFSSYGHKGKGSLDIFKSNFENGNYQKTENLPSPFNSKYDDFAFVIDEVKNTGYFTSNRKKGKGDVDIYAFKPKEEIIVCTKVITGLITNVETQNSIDNVHISLYYNDVLQETKIIVKDSKYSFKLNCNENYKIVAEKENYNTIEFKIVPDINMNNEISKNLEIAPIECNQLITGKILNSESNLLLEFVQVSIYQNNILKETKNVTSEFNFNLECNESYKIVAEKEKFTTSEVEFQTNNNNAFETSKTLLLAPIECNQLVNGKILNRETNLPIQLVQVSLYHNNILKETKNASNDFNFNLECNESYKIVAEKENFTSSEVEFQTNNTNTFETNKTLLLAPIECNQLVTGKILNRETNLTLEFVQVSLYQNNILKETKNVTNEFHFDLECNKSYKIVAEKENFTTSEVEFQTNNNNAFETNKTLLLTPIECNQLVSGKILNSETNLQLEFVQVSIYQNNILKETKNVTNDFNFNLECNSSYKIVAEKENFTTSEVEFQTNNNNAFETSKTLLLIPLECTQVLSGFVLDKETDLPISKALVTIFKNDILIDTLTLNNKANFNYKFDCNTAYKIVASMKNYEDNITIINTSKNYNEILNKTLLMEPTIEFITIREQKMIKTNPIYFDLDKDEILLDAAIELEKVIEILNKYPKIKLEIKSHTDSRAPDNYNLSLSEKRASSTINYITSKGISSNRLVGKGYGETQLVNKCSNGIKCTQAEHQLNRRTEFVIIQE